MFFKYKYISTAKMSPKSSSRSFNLKVFWSFNENMGIFLTYLLYFYISVLTSCLHVNARCCANMTNLLFTHKVKVNVKVTKRQNLAEKTNFSSF